MEVHPPAARLFEIEPGRVITTSVVVDNRRAEAETIAEQVTLPQGCQRVATGSDTLVVDAGGQAVRILAISVPSSMPAGRFECRYTAQSTRDKSVAASLTFPFQVIPVDHLNLVVETRSGLVLAGDVYPVSLHVTNGGNCPIRAALTFRSSFDFPVKADVSAFKLGPGETREITCQVTTDKAFAKHVNHAVTFDVEATSSSGRALKASQASVVEIVPLITGDRDPFHHFPMQLRLIGLGEKGQNARFQAELSGEGSLDEEGKQGIDFLFRGPDIRDSSLFGERDEYGASFHGEHWDVDLGDRIYALSPLTERQSLGRGAGVQWHDGQTAAGLFYMSTRFRQENTEELGAYVRQDLTPQVSVQGNFLRKSGGDAISGLGLPQDIVTVEPHFRFGKALDLVAEAGVSRSENGASDSAYHIEAHGQLPGKLGYSIEHSHAGPDFHGYYSNTDTTYATVSKALTDKLQANAWLNRSTDNFATSDILSSVVNREQSWYTGLEYAWDKSTKLTLGWQHTRRADLLQPAAYDFTESYLHTGFAHQFGKVQLQSFLDLGSLDNFLTGEHGPFQRYSTVVDWRPTARQSYTVFGSYGPSAFTGSSAKSLGAGVSANWEIRDHFTVNLSYGRNQYDGLTGHDQDLATGSIRYEFQNKNSILIQGRWSRENTKGEKGQAASLANETALLVAYTIPLSMTAEKKRSIGGLQGRVYDSAKGRGAGVPRVVLQVGEQYAVTDNAGAFEFPGLRPGNCELKIVPDSLGPRMAVTTPMPLKIRIRPAETSHVEITAAPACSVAVKVMRYEFADGNALQTSGALREADGVEAAVLELSNGRDTWRALTDRTGCANFERLPEGRWTLRVAGKDLPAQYSLEDPDRTLDLKPGENREATVRLLPQRRVMRMIDGGAIR